MQGCSILCRCVEAEDTDLFLLAQAASRAGDAKPRILRAAQVGGDVLQRGGRDSVERVGKLVAIPVQLDRMPGPILDIAKVYDRREDLCAVGIDEAGMVVDVVRSAILKCVELNGDAILDVQRSHQTAKATNGVIAQRIVVNNEGHPVGTGSVLGPHIDLEREGERLGEIDAFFRHHAATLHRDIRGHRVEVQRRHMNSVTIGHEGGTRRAGDRDCYHAGDAGEREVSAQ